MDPIMHEMMPEDEIFMCGMILLYGFAIGAIVRLGFALLGRRTA